MNIQRGLSHILQPHSFQAGKSAMEEVIRQLGGFLPDFLMLFITVGHNIAEAVAGIREVAGDIPMCGCSGAGIISHMGCDEATQSLGLLGLKSESVRFSPFIFPDLSAAPLEIGRNIGKKIKLSGLPSPANRLLFLFPDGLTLNADPLHRGISDELGEHIDCIGGASANDYRFKKTYQFCGNRIYSDAVSGVLISGDFHYQVGISHGARPFGLFRQVTKADGNIIYEIDHKPALHLLRDLLGERRMHDLGQVLNMFELGQSFEGKDYSGDILNRAIIGIDSDKGSIKLGAQIPEGATIRITRRDKERVLRATRKMVPKVITALRSPQEAIYFYFNCSGRGTYLFGEPSPDVDSLRNTAEPDKDLIGFFTFGEIAPVMGRNYYHNYTGVFAGLE
ncbi:hypothetical protein DENIS_1407 [Desulfonema ishimotonii]|uniref:Histidine kinase n=1 Tax=Desulfonema ishimotonii TaxID=45657 RepID=A0A401FU24_9BACT|nr:FIST N-terminal domain-containing protein [Desulfonema ishimotonii]GBC60454.1 hypothetical protein DENIS_1407 [Desulfonema ishimotonii]